jgi:hypothetical protein
MPSARVLFISADDAIVLFYSFFHFHHFALFFVRGLLLFIEISLGSQPTKPIGNSTNMTSIFSSRSCSNSKNVWSLNLAFLKTDN